MYLVRRTHFAIWTRVGDITFYTSQLLTATTDILCEFIYRIHAICMHVAYHEICLPSSYESIHQENHIIVPVGLDTWTLFTVLMLVGL
jgi:hypothetical protein